LRQGDEGAARQVVDKYLDRLLTLARRRIGAKMASRVDPEDITQSVFRTVFQRMKDGRVVVADQDDLCKLLIKITLHKTLRQVAFHRAAKRDPSKETEHGAHHQERLLAILSREPSPDETITFMDELEHLLNELTPKQRQIIELRLQGYSNDDIVKQLNLKYDRKIRRLVEEVKAKAKKIGLLDGEERA
jgi:RNA polymerase sigma factor (sigma-70 family)